ncbi:MAG: hypothetical protein PHR35_22570, partial [Kiritimatiellae bacterium]|nr:hypothetical protein [Kiritimatiellia bacterium]
DAGFAVEIAAQSLARFIWLEVESAGASDPDPIFSDNCFDLPAGRKAEVTVAAKGGWTLAKLRAALRARSIADSY